MAPEPRGRCSRRNLALSRGRGARVRNQRVNPIQVPGSKPRQRGPLEPTACPSAITTGRAYRDGLPTRGASFCQNLSRGIVSSPCPAPSRPSSPSGRERAEACFAPRGLADLAPAVARCLRALGRDDRQPSRPPPARGRMLCITAPERRGTATSTRGPGRMRHGTEMQGDELIAAQRR